MNLIPEKRLDKTGKLVTRHVRASAPAAAVSTSIPAPMSAHTATPKAEAAGKLKLRPKQLQQKLYREDSSQLFLSPQMRDEDHGRRYLYNTLRFSANDVETLSVLAVAYDSDAMKMLDEGVRTTEEALAYMSRIGMTPPYDRSEIVQEALRRNISVANYREFFRSANLPYTKMNSPYIVDAMELYSSASLRDNYHAASHDILDGKVRFQDIKYLGFSKLKPYHRLAASIEALRAVNEPDAKFTIDDVKKVLDHYHGTGSGNDYRVTLDYLIYFGPEFVESVNKHALRDINKKYSNIRDNDVRRERTAYHLALQGGERWAHFNTQDVAELQKSGVDPVRAGDLIRGGMDVRTAINTITEELPPSLGEGWL